jgi:hypothetical protein
VATKLLTDAELTKRPLKVSGKRKRGGGKRTSTATDTLAREGSIVQPRQRALPGLAARHQWDPAFDPKAERERRSCAVPARRRS